MDLTVQSLTCGYAGEPVLTDVSFSLKTGEVTALLGPNGCGKSTLLRTITKTLPAISGSVAFDGSEVSSLSFLGLAKLTAFVPQDEIPEFGFTVREVTLMGRMPHSGGLFETAEDLRIGEAAMARAECVDLANRPVTQLSSGERQRVLIARALAQETPWLLMDEPSAHMDLRHQLWLGRTLRELAKDQKGVLVVVHDLNLAAQCADRVLLLHGGKLVLDCPTSNALHSPELADAYGVTLKTIEDAEGGLHVLAR